MDERNTRTERPAGLAPDVDIRRSLLMGSGVDRQDVTAPVMLRRAMHWGPVWSGVASALVISFLLTCVFVGLGFTAGGTAARTLASASFNWPTGLAMAIGVFVGGYIAGFVADKHARTEGILDGFMVGVMAIFIPLSLAILGVAGRAGVLAGRPVMMAGYAWGLFVAGVIVLALATIGGKLGYGSSEAALLRDLRMHR